MENMSKEDYLKLVNEINMHNYYYHVLDQPIISDAEFDKLILQIRKIEAEHQDWITDESPTRRVDSKIGFTSRIVSICN